MKRPFTREQRTTMIYGILCLVLIIVSLQLWLLAATMNAYLGGDEDVVVPAALVSLGCFAANFTLLRRMLANEHPSKEETPNSQWHKRLIRPSNTPAKP